MVSFYFDPEFLMFILFVVYTLFIRDVNIILND